MSPEAERNLKRLVEIQEKQYRYQSVKTSFASDLIFKVLPWVAAFQIIALALHWYERNAR